MNSDLEINVPNFVNQFKFMTYNVDQAMREEKFEETKWKNRKDRIIKLIKEVNPDIMCLQEFRQLPENESVNKFLSNFDDYKYEIDYRNPSSLSFGQVIMYKSDKFYPVQKIKRWLSSTPEKVSDDFSKKSGGTTGFGYILTGVQFAPVHDGKIVNNSSLFWVFNTHFGLEEELKTKSCYVLKEQIKKITNNQPFVLSGDFNLFPDLDADVQRDVLCHHLFEMQDLAKGAKTLNNKQVEGTFVGFEHDTFKADLHNMKSRLDHIFGSLHVKCENPILYTKTMLETEPEELTTRLYPSDHLPIVGNITIN